MEVAADTKVITIHMKCDGCGKGYMLKDGEMLLDHGMIISPVRYKHRCNKCGNVEYYTRCYPIYKYVQLEDFREMTFEERLVP